MSTTNEGLLASSSSLSRRGWIKSSIIRNSRKPRLRRSLFWPKPQQYQKRYLRRRANAEELECTVQFEQQDHERVNLDRREVDNSGSCSEGRHAEREKSSLDKKFNTTRTKCPRSAAEMVENEPFMYNKLVAGRDAKVTIWTDLNFWNLSFWYNWRCAVRHSTNQIGRNPRHVYLTEGVCLWKHVQCWLHAHACRSCSSLSSCSSRAAARGLARCPWYHPAWVSVGTPVGPGKDTHGTLGPDQREGRGWPEHSSTQQYSAGTPKTNMCQSLVHCF